LPRPFDVVGVHDLQGILGDDYDRAMSATLHLSLEAARSLHLAAQGLLAPPVKPATKRTALDTIRRMGALQIDSINVIARSPYLALWSRIGAYDTGWLDELLRQRKLFEYWAHAMCFLPIEDYPLYRRRMLDDWEKHRRWLAARPAEVELVLARIRQKGSVRASDFPRLEGKAGTWWDWKVEKQILELLHWTGDLMIARRENFQRVYSLRERVLPGWDDEATPSPEAVSRALVLKAVRALGIAKARWVPDFYTSKQGVVSQLESLVDEGELAHVRVEGWMAPAYIHPDLLPLARRAARGRLQPTMTTLLSPFDPVVADRQRAEELFDFTYRIEVYTPSAKRRYGYYTLPILHRGALIGRLDPKAHRSTGRFEVRNIHLEPGVEVTEGLVEDLTSTLQACAAWHQTPKVLVGATEPAELGDALRAALESHRTVMP
jgi:uncharacterized protein YcaQ